MKASIGDVALKAGVSNATVSRTFAHPEQVSEATRIKVQAAADALNFSISRSARILKSGRTYRVALLIGSHAIEWFTAEIIAGLNDVLRDAGYDLVIYPIEGAEARDAFFEELPVRNNADAVFVSSFGVCTFLTVTNGFKMFDQNLALTNGAPSNSSELLALNIYRTFYGRAGFEGVGQAKAVVFFIIVAVIALIQNKLTTSKEVQA